MVRSKTDSVERENDLLRFDIQKAAENVARLPLLLSGNQWSALGFVPDQVTASIVSQGILIVTNSVSFIVEELAVFGCPADLHDSWSDDQGFVVPDAMIGLKSAANTFKGRSIATRFQSVGRDFQIFTDVLTVQHDVDGIGIRRFVSERPTFVDNWIISREKKK